MAGEPLVPKSATWQQLGIGLKFSHFQSIKSTLMYVYKKRCMYLLLNSFFMLLLTPLIVNMSLVMSMNMILIVNI